MACLEEGGVDTGGTGNGHGWILAIVLNTGTWGCSWAGADLMPTGGRPRDGSVQPTLTAMDYGIDRKAPEQEV